MKKTSNEWYNLLYPEKGLKIIDPDGWDRTNFHFSWYEELITQEEFHKRVADSTISLKLK